MSKFDKCNLEEVLLAFKKDPSLGEQLKLSQMYGFICSYEKSSQEYRLILKVIDNLNFDVVETANQLEVPIEEMLATLKKIKKDIFKPEAGSYVKNVPENVNFVISNMHDLKIKINKLVVTIEIMLEQTSVKPKDFKEKFHELVSNIVSSNNLVWTPINLSSDHFDSADTQNKLLSASLPLNVLFDEELLHNSFSWVKKITVVKRHDQNKTGFTIKIDAQKSTNITNKNLVLNIRCGNKNRIKTFSTKILKQSVTFPNTHKDSEFSFNFKGIRKK